MKPGSGSDDWLSDTSYEDNIKLMSKMIYEHNWKQSIIDYHQTMSALAHEVEVLRYMPLNTEDAREHARDQRNGIKRTQQELEDNPFVKIKQIVDDYYKIILKLD